ncbi:hypothetical protein DPMN_155709 [Dreissena polymorpha]|uniref:Uncharacterized protein n=1 Tax=Dreissena polymorpha TaxID=45954 RepID=A0A9D4JBL9_DREPO|nr:hypothetical protein DPMN_155709 [Dreissena polymorpha]
MKVVRQPSQTPYSLYRNCRRASTSTCPGLRRLQSCPISAGRNTQVRWTSQRSAAIVT